MRRFKAGRFGKAGRGARADVSDDAIVRRATSLGLRGCAHECVAATQLCARVGSQRDYSAKIDGEIDVGEFLLDPMIGDVVRAE